MSMNQPKYESGKGTEQEWTIEDDTSEYAEETPLNIRQRCRKIWNLFLSIFSILGCLYMLYIVGGSFLSSTPSNTNEPQKQLIGRTYSPDIVSSLRGEPVALGRERDYPRVFLMFFPKENITLHIDNDNGDCIYKVTKGRYIFKHKL